MATIGDVRVGDVGTQYRAKIQDAGAPFDPSSATVARLLFKPPHVAEFARDATITTDGTNWYLNYTVPDETDVPFHGRPGLWRWQGYVEFPDGQRYHTTIETYWVGANLDATAGASRRPRV